MNEELNRFKYIYDLYKTPLEGKVLFTVEDPKIRFSEFIAILIVASVYLMMGFCLSMVCFSPMGIFGKLEENGLFMTLIIFCLGLMLFLPACYLVHSRFIRFINRLSRLTLDREKLEVSLYPIPFFKQKVLIKDIESINIRWQRFFWGGKKVPFDDAIKSIDELDLYGEFGVFTYKVNLKNKKSKVLRFKLKSVVGAEYLRSYILTPQQFSSEEVLTKNLKDSTIQSEDNKLFVYSSPPLLSDKELEESRNIIFNAIVMIAFVIVLTLICGGSFMIGSESFKTVMLVGSFSGVTIILMSYNLLRNALNQKIEVTRDRLVLFRIGFPKKKILQLPSTEIASFLISKSDLNAKKSTISVISQDGISTKLPLQFQDRKDAEALMKKMQSLLMEENKIEINLKQNETALPLEDVELLPNDLSLDEEEES